MRGHIPFLCKPSELRWSEKQGNIKKETCLFIPSDYLRHSLSKGVGPEEIKAEARRQRERDMFPRKLAVLKHFLMVAMSIFSLVLFLQMSTSLFSYTEILMTEIHTKKR